MGSFLYLRLCLRLYLRLPIPMPTPVLAQTRRPSLFAWARAGTLSWVLGAAALCVALAPGQAMAQAASSAASQAVSPAETLLFETDHLARIKPPAVLVYEFRKVSNVEPGFSDKVRLDLAGSKGKTSATLHFLSGAHKHDIPALEDAHGNPVLLGFLERDIAEMKRLTGGSTAYFRKRIRMALAEDAHISAQSISYQGKSLPAQAVRIQPYLNDPLHARFEPYVHKTYTFVVSDGVPGGIVQVRSSLENGSGRPAADAPAKGAPVAGKAPGNAAPAPRPAGPLPAIDETLTFVSVAQPGQ
jgi:hypothetical protein